MAWYSTGVAAVGVASSIFGGNSAADAAAKAAKQQSQLTFRQRMEEIRQKQRASEYEKGAGVAAVAASNIINSGSSKRYLDSLNMDNMREIAFAKDAANKERDAILAGAKGAGDSLFYKAAGDAIGFAANAFASGAYDGAFGASAKSTFAEQSSAGLLSYSDAPGGMQA